MPKNGQFKNYDIQIKWKFCNTDNINQFKIYVINVFIKTKRMLDLKKYILTNHVTGQNEEHAGLIKANLKTIHHLYRVTRQMSWPLIGIIRSQMCLQNYLWISTNAALFLDCSWMCQCQYKSASKTIYRRK